MKFNNMYKRGVEFIAKKNNFKVELILTFEKEGNKYFNIVRKSI